jgi:hypothetical protein
MNGGTLLSVLLFVIFVVLVAATAASNIDCEKEQKNTVGRSTVRVKR